MNNDIYVRIPKNKIAFLTKIIESYDNLAMVSTIDAGEGLVRICATIDTLGEISPVLQSMEFVEIILDNK